uniref:Putative secreted protein n=1 Tax=Ixodes ricinus TaxID=34613 RepID=A0A6B0V0W4_IXORI
MFSASIISLVSWLWCLPSTAQLLSSTEQPQSRQWMPKCLESLLVKVFLRSRRRSFRDPRNWQFARGSSHQKYPKTSARQQRTVSYQESPRIHKNLLLQPSMMVEARLDCLLTAERIATTQMKQATTLCLDSTRQRTTNSQRTAATDHANTRGSKGFPGFNTSNTAMLLFARNASRHLERRETTLQSLNPAS